MVNFFKKIKDSVRKAVPKKTTKVTCPACKSEFEVTDTNKAAKCPNCKYKFYLQPPAA